METKKLVLRTEDAETKFEIDKIGKRLFVFYVHQNGKGSKQTKKIGETNKLEGAIQLATIFSGLLKPEITVK
jgi:hypothetical protein